MPRLGVFLRLLTLKFYEQMQRFDFNIRLASVLSCFVGHPVSKHFLYFLTPGSISLGVLIPFTDIYVFRNSLTHFTDIYVFRNSLIDFTDIYVLGTV